MRVKADFDLCESNGVCEIIAPDVFELDDDDYLVIKVEEVPDDQVDLVRRAVDSCPRRALSIAEE
ncbi:MAG: ferredoxin [Nocardioides sp.]